MAFWLQEVLLRLQGEVMDERVNWILIEVGNRLSGTGEDWQLL
jgi:hypothetical protein